MSKARFTWDGEFLENLRNPNVTKHYAITLVVMDTDNPDDYTEYYPKIPIEAIFRDNHGTMPLDLYNVDEHVTEKDHKLMESDPLYGGLIVLDRFGFIPLEYIDKHYLMLYYEYENCADMLENNVYDPVNDHGRFVLVKNAEDDGYHDKKYVGPHWAIYRLCGEDTHDIKCWERAFVEPIEAEAIKWERFSSEIKSAALEVDDMVRKAHSHDNPIALRNLGTDENGRLTYMGKKIMYRTDYNTLLTDITEEELHRMRGNDSASLVYEEKAVPNPVPTFISTAELDTIEGLFKDRNDVSSIQWMDTARFKSWVQFAKNCYKLKHVPTLAYTKAEDLTEAYSECPELERFYGFSIPNADRMGNMFFNDKSLEFIGTIEHSKKLLYIMGAFQNCAKLINVPKMNYATIPYISYTFSGCESIVNISEYFRPKAMNWTFARCKSLKSVQTLDMSECTTAKNCFMECPELEYVGFLPNSLTISVSFAGTKLSLDCAREIISSLPTVPTERTLDLRGTPARVLNASEIHAAYSKGWKVTVY